MKKENARAARRKQKKNRRQVIQAANMDLTEDNHQNNVFFADEEISEELKEDTEGREIFEARKVSGMNTP